MKERGISLIALIITIIVIIILAAISIAGVSGIVERSRYAKFCGDLDAVQDAVSQAYGTKRIKEAQNPDGLKTSEEIYKWVATGGVEGNFATKTGPNKQELYKLADESVLGLDLPKYGNSDWGVDPKTGEVFLVDGFEYDNHMYYSKTDVQNGGKEKGEEGDVPEEPSEKGVYAKLYNDGTLILSSTDYTDSGHGGVKENYGTDIWHEIEGGGGKTYSIPKWIDDSWTNLAERVIIPDTIQPTDTNSWFDVFEGTIVGLENIDTSNVTDMSCMFESCSNLTTLEGLSSWHVENVKNMSGMFAYCSLTTLDGISDWNTSNVTDMSDMFSGCSNLTTLEGLSSWHVENVKNMSGMFAGCSLTTLDGISGWNTENVKNMSCMFCGCTLTTLDGISGWNTENVKNMSGMFVNSTDITALNLPNWNTKNVEDMSRMFDGCFHLTTLEGISKWNTAKVKSMYRMFAYCSDLNELDLSGWDIQPDPDGTDITDMFTVTTFSTVYVKDETVKSLLENGRTGKNASTQIKIKGEETADGNE